MKWLSLFALVWVVSCRFVSEAATPRYFTVLKSFGFEERSVGSPSGELCLGSDGRFYGIGGGGFSPAASPCTIFSVAQDGSNLRILHRATFAKPSNGLIEASDGRLYGYGESGLFSIRKDGSDFKLWPTPGRWTASKLLEGSDGLLYGVSEGDVFRVGKDGQGFQQLRQLNGVTPRRMGNNLLELPGGVLVGAYGNEWSAGGIYRMNLEGSDYRLIYEMAVTTNGSSAIHTPLTGLKLIDGKLFGVAVNTTNGRPTIFSMNTDGSDLKLLHTLTYGPAAELAVGPGQKIRGVLGFEPATVFEIDYDGSNYKETELRRGDTAALIRPTGTPVVVGDRLYGLAMTLASASTEGFLYEFRPELEKPTSILTHLNYAGGDGWLPNVVVHSADGNLYGASMRGGAYDGGTVWRIGENGEGYRTLRSFGKVSDGGMPVALVEGGDSWLFGITQGTSYSIDDRYHAEYTPWNGHVFRITKSRGGFEILRAHTFEWASALTVAKDGRVYVSVSKRPEATNQSAYIYSMKQDGSDYAELARFEPSGPIRLGEALEGSDGNFYVTGGSKIFRVSTAGKVETIHDRYYPTPYALMEGSDGGLYGNNTRDGFFRMNKDGSGYSSKAIWGSLNFAGKRMVEEPGGEFLVVDDDDLYRIDRAKEYPETMRSFTPWQQRWEGEPVYGLVKGGSGNVYGLMKSGGAMGIGALFRLGNWTEAPQVSITKTNVTNLGDLMVTTRGSLGTHFGIESAATAEGPWNQLTHGGTIGPDGSVVWRTAQTNGFFRARLLEY